MRVRRMGEAKFDDMRYSVGLDAGMAYAVTDDYDPTLTTYGYSLDGEGVHWYTTMADLKAEHE